MKTFAAALTIALSAVLMLSDTAQARRWVYVPAARARLHVAPRVAVRTVHPIIVPYTVPYSTTFVTPTTTPTFVVGPRGRLHYVAPYRPLAATPTIIW